METSSPDYPLLARCVAEASRDGQTSKLLPGLYVVATPIGNLGDISLRALWTLRHVDRIACEDTRQSGALFAHYGIKKPLFSYHDHNADKVKPRLLAMLAAGERIALVCDAGMPLIADPGFKLVRACRKAGHAVTVVPGANAALTALAGSGLPTDHFYFAGFLPPKQAARKKAIEALENVPATLVFYEAPQRLAETLIDLEKTLGGGRPAAVARELTKLFEETKSGTLTELASHYRLHDVKGEIVILVAPAGKTGILDSDRGSRRSAERKSAHAKPAGCRYGRQCRDGGQKGRSLCTGALAARERRQMKKTNHRTGLAAEALCRVALRLKGYGIVASRYRSPLGEIDIVAKRGNYVALIEVKARSSRAAAAEAVGPRQRQRLQRAALDFLARHPYLNAHYLRFDVMLVAPWRWPVHIRDAWRPE